MPSATTADNKDSIAPSMAIVKAGPIKEKILSKDRITYAILQLTIQ